MKIRNVIIFLSLIVSINVFGQKIYDEEIDALKQIDNAIEKADKENKYVLAMVGGNWCKWCLIFNEKVEKTPQIKQFIEDNFVFIHINYSKNNKNEKAMERLNYPNRFGFPVFVILNQKGERIHTQNSAYLEENNGYSDKKVMDFLDKWTIKATTTSPFK
ncbi:MAG: thioredoxin family protein [Bacteroidales bacterium]|nr:thioredoxin family protein [Bacteroidales bacterium]